MTIMGPKGESMQDLKHKVVAPVKFILPQMRHQQGKKHNMRILQALLIFLAHISNHCFHYRWCWHPQILSIYMASCEPIFRVKIVNASDPNQLWIHSSSLAQ